MLEIDQDLDEKPEVRELSAAQRRVLGVLLEKSFTTPEYYPMTLKAVVAACNQKSNRYPMVDYDEDRAEDVLTELRELGLVAVIRTESGRTERYRHYVRKRYKFSERQLAILTELLLRGRQSLGELRGRACRMVAIDDLGALRDELEDLVTRRYAQASGSLDRRGIEVDHAFYRSSERNTALALSADEPDPRPTVQSQTSSAQSTSLPATNTSRPAAAAPTADLAFTELKKQIAELQEENRELRVSFEQFQSEFEDFRRRLGDL